MDKPTDARSLPFRLEQALLAERLITTDQLTVVYKFMAAEMDAASASLRKTAIAMSSSIATDTFNEQWDCRVRPLVTQLRALRELFQNVRDQLTEIETPLQREPVGLYEPPQVLRADTSARP